MAEDGLYCGGNRDGEDSTVDVRYGDSPNKDQTDWQML